MASSRMTTILVLLFAVACGSAYAALIPCPAAKLSQYIQPGFACTESINGVDFIFKQFTFQGPPQAPAQLQIDVLPIEGQDLIGLHFSGFMGSEGTYQIDYLIDPPPPIIRGEQIAVDPVMLTTILCPSVSPAPCLVPFVLTATDTMPTASVNFPMLANMLSVKNTFTLISPSTSNGFDNRTLLIPPPYPPAVPEPASLALTLFGLMGLLAFRSRAKLRQVLLELRS